MNHKNLNLAAGIFLIAGLAGQVQVFAGQATGNGGWEGGTRKVEWYRGEAELIILDSSQSAKLFLKGQVAQKMYEDISQVNQAKLDQSGGGDGSEHIIGNESFYCTRGKPSASDVNYEYRCWGNYLRNSGNFEKRNK